MSDPAKKIVRISRENIDPQGSSHSGLIGWYERSLRVFKRPMLAATVLTLMLFVAIIMGISATPGILVVSSLFRWSESFPLILQAFTRGTAVVLGYMAYGFTATLVVPLANRLIMPLVKPFRGPYYSVGAFGWFVHNSFTYILRYTFLDWITPTPFNLFFYRQMGMKIGKRVEINSSNISDPGLITLEDGVTIGGSASLLAHYAAGGYLVIAPVVIRKGATIGLRAIVMGGVEIGERAKILPNSVVLPKTSVPAGETWAGVPAKRVEKTD